MAGNQPVVAISPHLDDAVLSAGAYLATRPGSVIIVVFAGGPSTIINLSNWDRDAGFRTGDDIIGARRAEDDRSAALLGATARHLNCWDGQDRDPQQYSEYKGRPVDLKSFQRLCDS